MKNIYKIFCLVLVDVKKAYDNVDLDILNEIVLFYLSQVENPDPMVLAEWQAELEDLRQLNMEVEGYLIKRINGLPQGSELAPGLFNLYTTFLLNTIPNLPDYIQIWIFADNWVIGSTAGQSALRQEVNKIQDHIKNVKNVGKLEFELDEAIFLNFDEIDENDPLIDPELKTKLLGIALETKAGKLNTNWNEATFKFPQIKSCPGYVALKYAKTFNKYFWK